MIKLTLDVDTRTTENELEKSQLESAKKDNIVIQMRNEVNHLQNLASKLKADLRRLVILLYKIMRLSYCK